MGEQEEEETRRPPESTELTDVSSSSSLFEGLEFWISRLVPSRSRYVNLIKQHGGTILEFERDAPIKLVDHTRSSAPPGCYSYEFVEHSLAKGELQDVEKYRIRDKRPVRPSSAPKRKLRRPFTLAEDQMLYDYLQPLEQTGRFAQGVKGVKIYEDIAEKYPNHTAYSWRDRYVRKLRGRPRPGGPSPDSAQTATTGDRLAPTSPEATTLRTSPRSLAARPVGDARIPSGGTDMSTEQVRTRTRISPTQKPLGSPHEPQATEEKTPATLSSIMLTQEERKRKRDLKDERSETPPSKRGHISPPARPRSRTSTPLVSTPNLPPAVASEYSPAIRVTAPKKVDTSTTVVPETPAPASSELTDLTDPARELLLELPFFPSDKEDGEESQNDLNENEGDDDVEDDDADDDDQPLSPDAWIDSRVQSGKAKDDRHATRALLCASLRLKLADLVLEHQNAGKGIPENEPGIWTAEDDQCLEASDTRKVQRVLEKHGARNFEWRWKFLSMTRGKFNEPSS